MEQHIRFRQQLTAVEDVLFPELKDFYRSSVTSSSARLLLESFPTPESVAAADPADLYRVVVTRGRNRRMASRMLDFQLAAADSAGLTEDREPLVRAQHWLLYQLRLLDRQLEDAETAIGEALAAWPEQDRQVLDSFPGMSRHRQAVLLSCIGDTSTFNSDRQLRKLLGWYPEARRSGMSPPSTSTISARAATASAATRAGCGPCKCSHRCSPPTPSGPTTSAFAVAACPAAWPSATSPAS